MRRSMEKLSDRGVEVFLNRNIAIGRNVVDHVGNLAEIETKKDDLGISAGGDGVAWAWPIIQHP